MRPGPGLGAPATAYSLRPYLLTWAYPDFGLPLAAAALALLLVLAYVLRTGRLARALGQRAGRLAWSCRCACWPGPATGG
ncbi:hypothetical protein, partial [Hymenobacter coccineus]|uniref:hypothetical protein n=1 Tax=Hymenobacter coccineus TaxID=1908235 RepID=UPI00114CB04B